MKISLLIGVILQKELKNGRDTKMKIVVTEYANAYKIDLVLPDRVYFTRQYALLEDAEEFVSWVTKLYSMLGIKVQATVWNLLSYTESYPMK